MKHSRKPYAKGLSGNARPFKSRDRDEGKKRFHSEKPKKPHSFRDRDDRPEGEVGRSKPWSGKPSFGKKPEFDKRRDKRGGFQKPRRHENRNDRPEPIVRGEQKPRDGVLIWGLHAARAAYLNPKRRCFRIWLTEAGQTAFEATVAQAKEDLLKRPDAKKVDRNELDRLTPPGSVHQGIVVEVAPLHEPALHEIISGDNPPELLLMLDQVTDPHNVGAILRSAAAFGAGAVIMTERNAPVMTGVQAKSASGALEHVPQVHVVNLARALDELQEAGYWRIGLAEEGSRDMAEMDLTGRTVLVLGAEGEGLRQLTRKKCDELARLPTGGAIGSLNVSNAAAVALYEVRRQKKAVG